MTGGRVRKFMRNLVGYAMGDPWPDDEAENSNPESQSPDAGTTPAYSAQHVPRPDHATQSNFAGSFPSSSTYQAPRSQPGSHPRHEGDIPRRPRTTAESAYRAAHSPPSGSSAVLVEADNCTGGVQGFQWYSKCLRRDGDGDVACSFLEEAPRRAHQGAPFSKKGSGSVHPMQRVAAATGRPDPGQASSGFGRDSLIEVPTSHLKRMGNCPIVSCIDGNLAHEVGPSQELVFA